MPQLISLSVENNLRCKMNFLQTTNAVQTSLPTTSCGESLLACPQQRYSVRLSATWRLRWPSSRCNCLVETAMQSALLWSHSCCCWATCWKNRLCPVQRRSCLLASRCNASPCLSPERQTALTRGSESDNAGLLQAAAFCCYHHAQPQQWQQWRPTTTTTQRLHRRESGCADKLAHSTGAANMWKKLSGIQKRRWSQSVTKAFPDIKNHHTCY